MAELVVTLGVPHTPLLWRLLRPPVPDDLQPILDHYHAAAEMLADARPDVIVMVASDHFRQLLTSNMPAFLIGRAGRMRGTHPNEQRHFGLPFADLKGDVAMAASLLGERQLPDSFDFSYSDEPWLDHSFMVPLLYLTPDLDVPVVPVYTNTNAPPIPTPGRFAELGRYIREVIDGLGPGRRVALVGTGHLAYELGGPRQFLGRSPDPDFDRTAVGWFLDGDVEAAVAGCSVERMAAAGNLTWQFLNFLPLLTAAGRPADMAEGVGCRFGNEPFLAWSGR